MGRKQTEDTKRKLSEKRLGNKNPFYGRNHTEEWKRNMSKIMKGRILTDEWKRNMSKARTGKKYPKISEAQRGEKGYWYNKHHTREIKRKISISNKGKIRSEETKQRISEAKTGRKIPKLWGANNSQWRGGISFEAYPTNWTKTLRRSIRERDHYTCQLCGELQGDRAFDVHHIDYDKKNCNPNNLITLCHQCNTRVNFNRIHWTKYFKGILK